MAAFRVINFSNDGVITSNELQQAFGNSTLKKGKTTEGDDINNEQYWEKLMKEIDTNKNGEISFQEFKDYMLLLLAQEGYTQTTKLQLM